MDSTIDVIVASLGGLLAGAAALLTAIMALRKNAKSKESSVDTSMETTLDVVEKFFENQNMINEFILDRIKKLEDKGDK